MNILRVNLFLCLCLQFTGETLAASSYTAFVPSSVTIPSTTTSFLKLNSKVNCDVTTAGHICTCMVGTMSQPFETFWLSGDDGYYVYYDATSSLTPGTTYPVRVDCKDNDNSVINKHTLNVVVTSNQSPTFTNPATSTVTIDARVTDIFTTIEMTSYSDPENDALTFTMTSSPNDNYFSIGAGDGVIRSAIDMHTATTLTHKLTVSATDSYNTVSPAYVLFVEITNINTAPSINGLPATVFLPESALAGDTIVVLSITDDGGQPLTPLCSATSTADNVKFTYDSSADSLVVKYDGAFDYEKKSSYSITCTVTDGYLSSPGNDVLTLIITNVNEPPIFDKDFYYCQLNEGNANSNTCALNPVITDPEDTTVSSVYFLASNNGSRFSYSISSKTVTFAVNYDLDQNAYPSDVTLALLAVDSGSLTSTATVIVHVNDVNDNACQTDTLKFYSLNSLSSPSKLGTFSQLDADVTSPNNQVHFDVTSGSPSSASTHVYVARDGGIYYTNLFNSSDGGLTFKVYVSCVDEGSPATTSTTTVLVYYDEVTTPTSTTTRSTTTQSTTTKSTITTTEAPDKDVWEYEWFKIVFGLLMALLGLLLLLGMIYLLCKYCSCPSRSPAPKPVTPHRPPTPRALTPLRQHPASQRPALQQPEWKNIAWQNNDKFEGTL